MDIKIEPNQKFKTFMIIDENYKCPAHCPFCTAKITKWEHSTHDWELLREKLNILDTNGFKFENLTISGNGEPACIDIDKLILIREEFDNHKGIFDYGRIQSCGELFLQDEKWELFKDFSVEITRCDIDPNINSKILNYQPYDNLKNFKKSNIMFNLALLNDNYDKIVNNLKRLIDDYPNVVNVTAKILNVNTLNPEDMLSPYSQWIVKHGVKKEQSDDIVRLLNDNFTQAKGYDSFTDRYEWQYKGVPIIMYARRADYGIANVVYYEGKLTDYHFNNIKI